MSIPTIKSGHHQADLPTQAPGLEQAEQSNKKSEPPPTQTPHQPLAQEVHQPEGNTTDFSALLQQLTQAQHPAMRQGMGAVNLRRLTIELPESLHRTLKVYCAQEGIYSGDLVRALLQACFMPDSPVR